MRGICVIIGQFKNTGKYRRHLFPLLSQLVFIFYLDPAQRRLQYVIGRYSINQTFIATQLAILRRRQTTSTPPPLPGEEEIPYQM